MASKRVMQQSIFGNQVVAKPEPEVLPPNITPQVAQQQLLMYGLPGLALLMAVIALTVALLK